MMGSDTGEMWRAVAEESQKKRGQNRSSSPLVLAGEDIGFTTHNAGAHLIVEYEGVTADFWPGTGKWIVRGGKKGRGVFMLVRELKGVR